MNDMASPGPVFTEDDRINLYHINELYGSLAREVTEKMEQAYGLEVPLTSGVWGGTYLIADPSGKALRKIWRLYCIVNLPQKGPLENHGNLEKFIAVYSDCFHRAFEPYGLDLNLKMWGGRLPFSNKKRPSFTLHMEDQNNQVNWLRAFFIWNVVPWEESIIADAVRIIKEYKAYFDLDGEPVEKDPKDLKFLLQDIIIIYRTLENACSDDFREHAEPIIQDLTAQFMKGLHDADTIRELYLKVYHNALIYGYEEALEAPYRRAGLDIHRIDQWPADKINWVPGELKEKLIPPIQELFAGFKACQDAAQNPRA